MINKGIPILISSKDLLDYISQEEIAHRYILGFKHIGESFKSEFRTSEKLASSRVFWGKYKDLMFKDFGSTSLNKAINVIQYVQYKYNLKYQSAINKIGKDFGLLEGKDSSFSIGKKGRSKVKREIKTLSFSPTIIRIKHRNWSLQDKNYWGQYYIPLKLLERCDICAISHMWLNDYRPIEFASTYPVYSYNYYYTDNTFRRKIYQPLDNQGFKWTSNINFSIVQNLNSLPKQGGNILFITSSFKDALVFELLGIYAIAPNSENTFLPEDYWNKIKTRWKYIYIYLDNDKAGIEYAKQISTKYKIPYIHNPIGEPKDISDYVKKYDLKVGRKLVENLIKEI